METKVNDLLDRVIACHGGLERWNKITLLECEMSITGATWSRKGWPDALKNVHVSAHVQDQRISYRPFAGENKRSRCTPAHTIIETLDGQVVKERHDPRSAFEGHTAETKWDDLHLAYFSGYAMWNYLATPFLFAGEGFAVEELPARPDAGEERRRLKVTFPRAIATHCREQVFYVDDNDLIARLDYVSEVSGRVPAAHYLSDCQDFGGIKYATKRRAYFRNPNDAPNLDRLLVAIDIAAIQVS
jgi:hypothetical protein